MEISKILRTATLAAACLVFVTANAQMSVTSSLPPIVSYILDGGTPSIKGSLKLPTGFVADAGGAEFEISTFPREFVFDGMFFTSTADTVTMAAGDNEVDYFIALPADSVASDLYRVEFECVSGCENLDITTSGYWNDNGQITSILGATIYRGDRENIVDIELMPADVFEGTVAFSGGYLTDGDEQIVVRVQRNVLFSLESFSEFIYPAAGQATIDYRIGVPTGTPPEDWRISFTCNVCGILSSGTQYASTLSGDPVTTAQSSAFSFLKGSDYSGVDVTIPLAPPPD